MTAVRFDCTKTQLPAGLGVLAGLLSIAQCHRRFVHSCFGTELKRNRRWHVSGNDLSVWVKHFCPR